MSNTKQRDIYDYIGIVAMIATPLAASIVFGWTVGTAVYLHTQNQIAAVFGGVGAAVGLETIGIYAGHVVMELWPEKRSGRFWLALSFLMAYSIAGIYELRTTELWILFVIAPVVYLIVALRHSVHAERTVTAVHADDEKQHRRKVASENRQHKREMERLKLELAAKAKQPAPHQQKEVRAKVPVSNGHLPGDFRLLSDHQKEQVKNLTTGELTQMADISDSTARRWKRQVSQNGHYK